MTTLGGSPPGGGPENGDGPGGYDSVTVPGENGQSRVLTRAAFEALPLGERVRHLMSGRLVFHRDGAVVSARDALRSV